MKASGDNHRDYVRDVEPWRKSARFDENTGEGDCQTLRPAHPFLRRLIRAPSRTPVASFLHFKSRKKSPQQQPEICGARADSKHYYYIALGARSEQRMPVTCTNSPHDEAQHHEETGHQPAGSTAFSKPLPT